MITTGQCYCGSLKYEIAAQAEAAFQCHCRECQYITGGHPNVLMIMPLDGFKFVSGKPQEFKRSDLEKFEEKYNVLSSNYNVDNTINVRVFSEKRPAVGFKKAEPQLDYVYFIALKEDKTN